MTLAGKTPLLDATNGPIQNQVKAANARATPLVPVLRLEALAAFAAACAAYQLQHFSWAEFAILFLVPDAGMAAYAFGPKAGAWGYNVLHTYIAPALLAFAGAFALPAALPVAVVWFAHIAFDRAMGYGLKLPEGFSHTHLGTIGKPRTTPDASPARPASHI